MSPPCRDRAEQQLYTLISRRIMATSILPVEQQTAFYSVQAEGITFSTLWEIDEPRAEYIGTSSQLYTVGDISVISVNEPCDITLGFTTVLHNLHRICAEASQETQYYNRHAHEWGTALEGLQRKGFISVVEGEILLTSEGERLIIDLQPYNLDRALLSPEFDGNRIINGDLKGRQAVTNFEKWLAATIGDMMRYVPKEDADAPIPEKSEDFTEQSKK